MRYYLKNLKVRFEKTCNDENINVNEYSENSKLFILKNEQNYSSLDAKNDLWAIIKSDDLINNNKLICSFECLDKKFQFEFPLNFNKGEENSSIKKSDMLHKIIFNKYISIKDSENNNNIVIIIEIKNLHLEKK